MQPSLFFGPRVLELEKVGLCLDEARKLHDEIQMNWEDCVGALEHTFALMKKVNPATVSWKAKEVESFVQLDLDDLYRRLVATWGELLTCPVTALPGALHGRATDIPYEVVKVFAPMAKSGLVTVLGEPLHWVTKLRQLGRLGIRRLDPEEPANHFSMSEMGALAGNDEAYDFHPSGLREDHEHPQVFDEGTGKWRCPTCDDKAHDFHPIPPQPPEAFPKWDELSDSAERPHGHTHGCPTCGHAPTIGQSSDRVPKKDSMSLADRVTRDIQDQEDKEAMDRLEKHIKDEKALALLEEHAKGVPAAELSDAEGPGENEATVFPSPSIEECVLHDTQNQEDKILVCFTVNDTEEGYRVTPTINEGYGLQVGLVPGYPILTFDHETDAVEHARTQIKQLCEERIKDGWEVVSATVVTPKGLIEVEPADGSEYSETVRFPPVDHVKVTVALKEEKSE